MGDAMPVETAAAACWLSILGLGEEGVAGLPPLSRGLLEDAEIVFGGRRHLELAAPLIRGEARPWPSPFDVAGVLAERGRRVVVLASGDPMWHGVGATLLRRMPPEEALVVPAPSAASLAAARLGWPLEGVVTLSLHGRPIELLRPHLHPGARILALTSDAEGPAAIAGLLRAGFAQTRITVLEALGGPRERIRATTAAEFSLKDVAPLNLVALEVAVSPGAGILSRAPGLPDACFEHDGQLTKRDIRAVTLSSLAPRQGELLWDVGLGAGSIAIEWLLRHPSMRAIGIEEGAERAARAARNAAALGTPDLQIVQAAAPEAFAGLPTPDAIFVGGGLSDPGLLDAAWAALKPGGRLVANAVSLQSEARLIDCFQKHGGEITRLQVAKAGRAGTGNVFVWRHATPVTQWRARKP